MASPALLFHSLSDTFEAKRIPLGDGQRVRIARECNNETAPTESNGYFPTKVMSRKHAEVWEQDGKVIVANDMSKKQITKLSYDSLRMSVVLHQGHQEHQRNIPEWHQAEP